MAGREMQKSVRGTALPRGEFSNKPQLLTKTESAYSGFRVTAVGNYKYSYDNNGRMKRIGIGNDALEFIYSPDKIIMKGSRAENDQTADVSYTAQGYLKSMNISTGTEKLSASYSYDGSGHLTGISVSYKSPQENYRTKTTLTWRDDLLRQIVFKDEDSNGSDTYQTTFEYDPENTIENPYLQFAPSLVYFESIGDGELDEGLAYAGKLGKGPRLLPSSCKEEWEEQDGDQTYSGSDSEEFRYGFNIDGALSYVMVGSKRYNYQFIEDHSDEPQDSSKESKGPTACTDGKHPHWIDLGLPSGTQWRCCNEGASAPEAYGGYYTFGQVGSAPSRDQIDELVNYCSYTRTTQNGVNGGKFTGPNGGTIFLPAAGCRWYRGLDNVGSWGYYWSSTPHGKGVAYLLRFYDESAFWSILYGRDEGSSVRLVR